MFDIVGEDLRWIALLALGLPIVYVLEGATKQ